MDHSFPIENDDSLKLQLKDVALEFSWPIGRIKEALSNLGAPSSSTPTSCSIESVKSISALVDEQNIPEAKIALASGVSAFLWLYTSIRGFKPATVVVTSDLPLGSGLGSSAAFCVALSAALLALSDSIIHGKPSGIDNTVSTYGNMIKFRSGNLTRITSKMPLKMLVTNTKVGRNTKALVAGVSERTLRHPNAMSFVFNAVDSISNDLANIILSPAPDDVSISEKEEKLEELMEMNQGLLQCMGMEKVIFEMPQLSQGILRPPSFRQEQEAECLASEVAKDLEEKKCEEASGSNPYQLANHTDFLSKCGINVSHTRDGVVLPVCVPNLDSIEVFTNYTRTQFAKYINDSKFAEAGLGCKGNWMVAVLSTATSEGDFAGANSLVSMIGFGHCLISFLLGMLVFAEVPLGWW
ncbi:hypothetical protein GH714_008959 [Hevea brasiliensis]|uniref:mevalonate kinase n=1 Tax=Hevea brasiliensis TaxID=3981 RepID=A0A6A6KAT2_HEVBR|nr:hypothetical protein GH714_008959 [Hevea brasiliensis]